MTDALIAIGVNKGSTIMVHPDAIVAAQFAPMSTHSRLDRLIEAIESAIGATGTLVIPVFSYSFTKDEVFDVRNTPSAVGMVGEHFRKLPGVLRSLDPIFSFACRGPHAEELCAIPAGECLGPQSVFGALHAMNADIIDLGCSLSRGGTFVHYVETAHGVDYRYPKTFSGTAVLADGQRREVSVVYNVRDLTRKSEGDLRRLQKRLVDEGKLRVAFAGRARIMAVASSELFNTVWKMLDEDPCALIAEGAEN